MEESAFRVASNERTDRSRVSNRLRSVCLSAVPPLNSSLDLRGLSLRGGERVERQVPVQISSITLGGLPYDTLVAGDVAVASVARISGGFLITVEMAAQVYGPCFRCLREVVLTVKAEQEEFVPQDPSEWEAEDLSPFIEGLVVDVSGIGREALVLALPLKVLCRDECSGLCPGCGLDLNEGRCDCATQSMDPRWEKLRGLSDPCP